MEPKDLITIIGLAVGLFLVVSMYILLKQKRLKPEALPRVLGVGAFVYGFVCMMTFSAILRPTSEFVNYTIENLFWSLAVSIMGYLNGLGFAQRASGQDK